MESVFVGRHPIYDRQMQVFAYELLYRGAHTDKAGVIDGNMATTQVLINTFLEIGLERLTDHHLAFLNLTREFLLNKELPLPQNLVVLEVLENIDIDSELVAAVQHLSKIGYRIALDDFAFEDKWIPLLDIADFIKVEVPAFKLDQLAEKIPSLRKYKAKILVEKVETHEEYEFLSKLGCDYFQGYFFCKPKVIEGKKVSINQAGIFSLLAHLQKPEVSVNDLDLIVSRDASLGFKLLKYLNSAQFGLGTNRFESIRKAIVYLGIRPLRSWISMLALCGVKGKPSELSRTALQRARQCEQFCLQCMSDTDTDSFFLAGLFSVLDALMDMPMEAVLQHLPVADDIKQGLLARDGRIGKLLDAVIDWEMGNPAKAEALPRRVGAPMASAVFLDAILWADNQMKAIRLP